MRAAHTFWAVFVLVGIAGEAVTLATRTPTLSQSWRHAREVWPTWASVSLSIVTVALGVWILGSHWVWSRYDLPGRTDDALLGFVGAVIGLAGWLNWRKHEQSIPSGLQPDQESDTRAAARGEDAT